MWPVNAAWATRGCDSRARPLRYARSPGARKIGTSIATVTESAASKKALQVVVPVLLVDDQLQYQPRDAAGMATGGQDGTPSRSNAALACDARPFARKS